ncbi:transcription initiation factor TFIID subunit 12 [Penicillium hetheringtonii]|uniref:Transcription initiation factor TFIID subunit 12 n=1 Tax=Penicillium hetheringtonii TaxID=911720 RepID=A0AAD6DJ72_9EURO|nr:transcription initiation factor TFIID subunit 12 [Penicillium hetheringtonii]
MTDRPNQPEVTPWPVSPTFCPNRSFPTVGDLVRLDQIPKFPHLSTDEKNMYFLRASHLWSIIRTNDESSHIFEEAFVELLGLSLLLRDGMMEFQKKEYGAYVRARKHEAEERRLRESEYQLTEEAYDKIIKLEYHLYDFSPELRFQIDAFRLYLPKGLKEDELRHWILETRLNYGNAIRAQEEGQKRIDDLANTRIDRQMAGNFLSRSELKIYDAEIDEATALYRKGVLEICNIRIQSEKRMKEGGKLCSKQYWP